MMTNLSQHFEGGDFFILSVERVRQLFRIQAHVHLECVVGAVRVSNGFLSRSKPAPNRACIGFGLWCWKQRSAIGRDEGDVIIHGPTIVRVCVEKKVCVSTGERERETRRAFLTFALRIIFPSDFCVLMGTSLPCDKELTACLMSMLLSAFPLLVLSAIVSGKMLFLLLSETTFLACLCCYGCETKSLGQTGR